MDNKKYLGCDFYEVEHDENGKAWIHDTGYCYGDGPWCGYNEETDEDDDPDWFYRNLEYDNLYLDPDKLREDEDYYDHEQEKVTQYEDDCNEEKILRILDELLDSVEELPMKNVTNETPDGWYVDYEE